ncbi:SUR7 family protein pun1 [Escovopsis weberi]|uniref:SUR7 family protein pun1 n=1 Tax=Escovopsis weberi TaxID=150374 RepID=A0A0M8N5C2_ESCWE|nr:SUR7 family protein pun1 [Escovopsis weberi]
MSNTTRRNAVITTALCYFIAIIFLILTIIGNITINSTLNDIYFFKLNVAQVGLWNFCEGYEDEGVTYCSPPKQFYWFNPVKVLVSELLAGAKIALPSQVLTILRLLQIGSQVMYAFFLASTVINTLLLLLTPIALRRRWFSAVLAFIGSISGILVSVAAVIASVISIAAKVALTAQDQLNIKANIGIKMFVFMWIGALLTDFGFLMQAAMGCCCLPQKGEAVRSQDPSEVQEKRSRFSMASFKGRRNATS